MPRVKDMLRPWDRLWGVAIPEFPAFMGWSDLHGTRLAVLSSEGTLGMMDAMDGVGLWRTEAHAHGACALATSTHHDRLATGGQDGSCRIWDAQLGTLEKEVKAPSAWVEHVAWSPDGTHLAMSSGRSLWLLTPAGEVSRRWDEHPSTIASIAWRPDGRQLVAGHYNGATLYHPDGDTPVRVLERKGSILSVAWHPRGRHLAAGCQDQAVQVWNMQRDDHLYMSGYQTKVSTVAWDAEGRYLATAGGPGATCWDFSGKGPRGSRPVVLANHRDLVTAITWSPHKPVVATSDQAGRTNLWRVAGKSEEEIARLEGGSGVVAQVWSPGGGRLVIAYEDGAVEVMEVH